MKPSSSSSRRLRACRFSSCWGTSATPVSAGKVTRQGQSRRLLECTEDKFFSQVIDSPTQGDATLDLMVTNANELITDIKTEGSLGCSDYALVEFTLLRDTGKARSMVRTLSFRKANFQLFKELVRRTPGKWSSGTGEQNRAGRSLRMLSIECRSSQSPGVRSQARKGRGQHG